MFDLESHFKVIKKESSIKDENLNEKIQKEGAHAPRQYGEGDWYFKKNPDKLQQLLDPDWREKMKDINI